MYADRKHLRESNGSWTYKAKKLNIYASIDFAFSLSKKSDYTAVVVIGIDSDGFIFVLDIARFRTDKIDDYFREIVRLHSRWSFKKLRAEVTVAQAVIARDLKDRIRSEGLRLSVDEFRPSRADGRKEERIAAALEHRYDNQTMYHFKGGYTEELEEELVMARPKNDDIKDALASAVEIAVKPRASRSSQDFMETNVISIHSKFGGIS
jgi:phage terminase large subunit-like protein